MLISNKSGSASLKLKATCVDCLFEVLPAADLLTTYKAFNYSLEEPEKYKLQSKDVWTVMPCRD